MKMTRILLMSLALLLALAVCIGCKPADDIQNIPTPKPADSGIVVRNEVTVNEHVIEVQGYGQVMAVPDYATITLGVQGSADTAEQASALCTENRLSVYEALLLIGVHEGDIVAAGIAITANTRESDGAVIGYVAADTLTIIALDIATANSVMSVAIDAGASDIHGITYSLTDATPSYQAALENAMSDAFTKATVLADAAGVTLGAVIGVSETPHDDSTLVGIGFETSPIAVSASVTVRYLIRG